MALQVVGAGRLVSRFKQASARARDLTPVMEKFATEEGQRIQRAFASKGGADGNRWAPRKDPSQPGELGVRTGRTFRGPWTKAFRDGIGYRLKTRASRFLHAGNPKQGDQAARRILPDLRKPTGLTRRIIATLTGRVERYILDGRTE